MTRLSTDDESGANCQVPGTAPVRLTFDELRARFPVIGEDGKSMPMPVRTARRQLAGIPHIKAGRKCWYPIECVEEFERKRTVQ